MLAHISALTFMRSYAEKGSDVNLRRLAAASAPIIERHLQVGRQLPQPSIKRLIPSGSSLSLWPNLPGAVGHRNTRPVKAVQMPTQGQREADEGRGDRAVLTQYTREFV